MTDAQKVSQYIPISSEMAMEYGLIPDTRVPPPPPTRRQRFRSWRQRKVTSVRTRLGEWVLGYSVRDYWDD